MFRLIFKSFDWRDENAQPTVSIKLFFPWGWYIKINYDLLDNNFKQNHTMIKYNNNIIKIIITMINNIITIFTYK